MAVLEARTRERAAAREAGAGASVNVGAMGRWASIVTGGALGALGLGRLRRGRFLRGLVTGLGGAALVQRGVTGHCSIFEALDIDTARPGASTRLLGEPTVRIARTITIRKAPEEVRSFFETPENLRRILPAIASIRAVGEHRLAIGLRRGPELTLDFERQGEDGIGFWASDRRRHALEIEGTLLFEDAPGDRGTEVSVEVEVRPPGGAVGAAVGRLLGRAAQATLVREALYRLRAMLETGEVPVSDDTSGRRARRSAPRGEEEEHWSDAQTSESEETRRS